jgi:hypothetical protein
MELNFHSKEMYNKEQLRLASANALRENPTLPTALVFAASQSKGSRQRSPLPTA